MTIAGCKEYEIRVTRPKLDDGSYQYRNTIHLAGIQGSVVKDRTYKDQTELVEIVNPLLRNNGDVNGDITNTLDEVHGDGWMRKLCLSDEEAARLGW